jgi:nitrilase
MSNQIVVGIVQSSPVFMDLEASLVKATRLIADAAGKGATLVAFGETWLAGYPAWIDHCPNAALWNYEPTREVFARLRQNSVVVPGREAKLLSEVAADFKVTLVIGVNERVDSGPGNGTLYNSLLTFGPNGELLNHHRKLVPTYTERLVWGPGDGDGLEAVETPVGRVGGLICWEHWMPLARHTLHVSGERIHVAVWPTVNEMHQIACRHYAFEGRCFVLAAGLIMPVKDLPTEFGQSADQSVEANNLLLRGGSCVIGPNGNFIAGPVFDEETILLAHLDPAAIEKEKMTLDVSGHYDRPDVFQVQLHRGSRLRREEAMKWPG